MSTRPCMHGRACGSCRNARKYLLLFARLQDWSSIEWELRRCAVTRATFLELLQKDAVGERILWNAVCESFRNEAVSFLRFVAVELDAGPGTADRLLVAAASVGNFQVFAMLMDAGADVNAVWAGRSVVSSLFPRYDSFLPYEKAQHLVQCPRLRPTSAAHWCLSCTPCVIVQVVAVAEDMDRHLLKVNATNKPGGVVVAHWLLSDLCRARHTCSDAYMSRMVQTCMHDKAKLLVRSPRLRPVPVHPWWCICAEDSWCHKTRQLFVQHAKDCEK